VAEQRYDAVVVGSGFGGSLMAHQLAEHELRVCVLERGNAWPPHSFPRTPAQVRQRGFWDPDSTLYGLWDVWSFRSQWAFVASGLGGGSLVYANVLMRMEPEWLEGWPVSYDELEPHYEAIEHDLGAVEYPPEHADTTGKTVAFRRAADALAANDPGLRSFAPRLAVTFANTGAAPTPGEEIAGGADNYHGHPRYTCRLLGECDVGCNLGAKNTLDFTYLSWADRKPRTEIRVLHEVKRFERDDDGWSVGYVDHGSGEKGTLRTKRLILSAGALGSTLLLLRNRAAIPRVSQLLGHRFSGNGDFLTFAARLRSEPVDPTYGPVITRALGVPDRDGTGGFFLEDGGYPGFLDWIWQARGFPRLLSNRRGLHILRMLGQGLLAGKFPFLPGNSERNWSAELVALLRIADPAWLPLLGMGRDTPDGILRLDAHGRLDLERRTAASLPYYQRVRDTSRRLAELMSARFEPSLFWRFNLAVTVHPLGGCPMGEDEREGVVSSATGEVFGSPGLHVADGSVLPGPAGANPSLTIAALSRRFAHGILGQT
jgi:cholesterol oxidase